MSDSRNKHSPHSRRRRHSKAAERALLPKRGNPACPHLAALLLNRLWGNHVNFEQVGTTPGTSVCVSCANNHFHEYPGTTGSGSTSQQRYLPLRGLDQYGTPSKWLWSFLWAAKTRRKLNITKTTCTKTFYRVFSQKYGFSFVFLKESRYHLHKAMGKLPGAHLRFPLEKQRKNYIFCKNAR